MRPVNPQEAERLRSAIREEIEQLRRGAGSASAADNGGPRPPPEPPPAPESGTGLDAPSPSPQPAPSGTGAGKGDARMTPVDRRGPETSQDTDEALKRMQQQMMLRRR